MSIQEKLISFAFNKAYPYITKQPVIKDHLSKISFILVGSAATGLCNDESDVDICLICDQETFDTISVGTRWLNGSPTEVIIDGTQLHFYGISTENLNRKISDLDYQTFYVYANAIVINDAAGQYKHIEEMICNPDLQSQRLTSEVDMLGRRKNALHYVLNSDTDPMVRIELCVELLKRMLICVALFDGRECDSRTRPYRTALLGSTGIELTPKIDEMFTLLGMVCNSDNHKDVNRFLTLFDDCFDCISGVNKGCNSHSKFN